jgi:undecaprenyl-diphosphatase
MPLSFRNLSRVALDWLRNADLALLLGLLVAVLGLWLFLELADEVMEGETHAADERLLLALRNPADPADPLGPPWVEEAVRDLTALGGVAILTLMIAAVVGYLLITRKYQAMWLVLIATGGGQLLSWLLKDWFDRPRPELVAHLVQVSSPSFPSGHALMSAVVYLTLGALLARLADQRRVKLYFLAVAALLTLLVGLSRVYLGVHYPTDVLAGWSAGLVWATLCWLAARSLQRRGAVERSAAGEGA